MPSVPENPQPSFTHTAVTAYKNPKNGFWYTVRVEVDPASGKAGEVTLESTESMDRATGQEAFRILAAKTVDCFLQS